MKERMEFYRYTGDPEFKNYVTVTVSGENKPEVEWIRGLLAEVIPSDMWDTYDDKGKWIYGNGDIQSTVNWRECWKAQQETEAGQIEDAESKKEWAIIKAKLVVKKAEDQK